MTYARRMDAASGLNALYWKLRLYLKALPFLSRQSWNAQQVMDDYFQSDRLKMVFTSILADFFTAPGDFPGLGVFALNPETSFDQRIPRELEKDAEQLHYYSFLGGIGVMVDALVDSIEEHGGRIHLNHPISGIEIDDNRVEGVVDEAGVLIPADAVVVSGGAKETFFRLVGEEHLPPEFAAHLRDLPLMDSVFMVHLGVDFDPSPYVHGVCTYYYGTYDIDRALEDGANGVYHEGRDGFVVHIPSLHTAGMAPPGHHAMTIYTICPDTLSEGNWQDRKEEFADKLITCAEQHIPGLGSHIQICEILTPDDWRVRTHLEHHAFGGIKPVLNAWRVPHQTPIKGLWFIGQQSESGGGVNAVMPAAYKTALQITSGVNAQ
jgi:phytoene dehydrogenase-like protein